ncbi:short-chain dehydrogenase [Raphidocelis subcapitata]|uniref:Short-chain dehydrogenase n=1 Tax=Raphidocelis subcapitata TaxID=307507 RepID=A0A2V0NQ00_9CHLO|nr:short-chain dehydrogenase [Raphidocelis subcapitata]|eukprot:GBF89706.1 short-chain dehydrogenase [Raphidocelis subcapitata]
MIANKTVAVTGCSSSGIGLEFLKQLLKPERKNTCVAAARRVSPELQRLADANPGRLLITNLDVADEASGTKVDVVINNAGIYGPSRQDLDTVDAALMLQAGAGLGLLGREADAFRLAFGHATRHHVFTTNALGPLLVVQQLRKHGLLKRPATMGSVDDNTSGACLAYRASKSALNIISKSLSIDLAGEGVTTVLLHPGYVRTPMTGGAGLIDVDMSVGGMLSVLESGRQLQGRWYAWDGKEIPW